MGQRATLVRPPNLLIPVIVLEQFLYRTCFLSLSVPNHYIEKGRITITLFFLVG